MKEDFRTMSPLALTLLASISIAKLAAICAAAATVSAATAGVIFRGAAIAWRDERDAAVDKAERLEETVSEQGSRIEQLEQQVHDLEQRTNVEQYAERSSKEHREIVSALGEFRASVQANTTALEFLFRQVFPAAVQIPAATEEPAG